MINMNSVYLRVGACCSLLCAGVALSGGCGSASHEEARAETADAASSSSGTSVGVTTGAGPQGQKGTSKTRTLAGAQVIQSGKYTMVLTVGTHDLNSRTEKGIIQ